MCGGEKSGVGHQADVDEQAGMTSLSVKGQ